ncbi:hypothetical protein DRP07_05885 [Archaeoglobales archaeon]|nr:MAG: hypothetical protein DRP07_05885 [Archaeoglobales archaeon]
MRISKILNFLVVNTSWCTRRIVEWLAKRVESDESQEPNEPRAIFLDIPREFEPYLKNRSLLQVLKERLDTRFKQHVMSLEPLFDFAFAEKIPLYCYKDSFHSVAESSVSFDLLTLVLKARFGKMELNKWREVVSKDLNKSKDFAEYEANFIAERAKNISICLNLNEEIERILVELGFEIKRIQFYRFNRPIDRIYSLIGEELSENTRKDSELRELIKKHVKFIDDVIEKGYEEACRIWEI